MNKIERIYFIGAGGIGMSALARYFVHLGKAVAGYDKTRTPLTDALESEGIALHFEDEIAQIPEAFRNPEKTLVVYTPAVPDSHTELNYFRNGHFSIKKRAEVLGLISTNSRCLAVAGTHGKTTTSCILAHLLHEAGLGFTAFLGGVSEDFGSNFVLEGTEFTVVEADEYDRSFLWLSPEVACVTSMDADHLDIYGTGAALEDSFREFAGKLKSGGTLLVRKGLPLQGLTYGIEDDSDYCIRDLRQDAAGYEFTIKTPQQEFSQVRFSKPGHHNLLNGVAAFAMAMQVTTDPEPLLRGLGTFKGVERRFSVLYKGEQQVYVDDYAHHPREIDAVYQALREHYPSEQILAVFQPHLFSRTRDFGGDFARSLSCFDEIWLLDIYPAREQPIAGIDSQWLLEQIENTNKKMVSKADLIPELKVRKPQVLVTMGAGDIGQQAQFIKKALRDAS
ncbi:MAG: UDP-N-acetylmuramate--L-alanine ligase [Robiginitalea sp.]|uniref:UDP-N-acetylmuramate--L-alanine ligase n=1 Tax=Robiginitalea sp. TaxID=1902411 RepID=UPI003C791DAA